MEPTQSFPDTDVNITFVRHGIIGEQVSVVRVDIMISALTLQMSVVYEILLDEFRYTASPIFHIAGQAMIFMHVSADSPP